MLRCLENEFEHRKFTLTAQTGEVNPSTAACIPSETKGIMFSPRRVSLYRALRMFRACTCGDDGTKLQKLHPACHCSMLKKCQLQVQPLHEVVKPEARWSCRRSCQQRAWTRRSAPSWSSSTDCSWRIWAQRTAEPADKKKKQGNFVVNIMPGSHCTIFTV